MCLASLYKVSDQRHGMCLASLCVSSVTRIRT